MGILDALGDRDFRGDVGRGLVDAANRGIVGGLLGAPVDLATGVVNAGLMGGGYLGHQVGALGPDQMPRPITDAVGGSEWIGQKMQDAGMVSGDRQPLAEFLASLAGPGAAVKGARGMSMAADELPGLLGSQGGFPSLMSQIGVMSKEGKARLLADLQARLSSGKYSLGDVNDGQVRALAEHGLTAPTNQVFMTDAAFNKLLAKRIDEQRYSPTELVDFAEQAMKPRAGVEVDPAKAFQYPALVLRRQWDPVTKRYYDARMPLAPGNEGFEIRSIFPDGLPPRKK